MASDHTKDPDADFSFGERELRQATVPQKAKEPAPPKAANENRGFDPYNTSGSFDRKQNWARVGKR
jgi:hypothetical protein